MNDELVINDTRNPKSVLVFLRVVAHKVDVEQRNDIRLNVLRNLELIVRVAGVKHVDCV